MDQETDDLKHHIDRTRNRLDENLREIEARVRGVVDIRENYQRYPLVAAGLAFAGGLILSLIGSGRPSQAGDSAEPKHRRMRGL